MKFPWQKSKPNVAPAAAELKLAATEPEAPPPKRHLFVWAESPEARQHIEQLLDHERWVMLPTQHTGANLVDFVRNGKPTAILFHYLPTMREVPEQIRLLEEQCPEYPRLVVCPDESSELFSEWQGIPPVVLNERRTPAENEERIGRAIKLNQWLMQPAIRAVLPRLRSIPTLPAAHQRVVQALQNRNFDVDDVAKLVAQDMALTANLLKSVNSAAMGLHQPVNAVPQAITMLGVERLQALVMSAWAFKFIDEQTCPGFDPQGEWEHALAVAAATQEFCQQQGLSAARAEAAFTAGMLHDVGKLLLAANAPQAYSLILADATESGRELWQVEQEDMGFSHAEIGGCMLGIWGAALPTVEAAAWHHEPSRSAEPDQLSPLTLVHLANCKVRGIKPDPEQAKLAGTPEVR